MASTIAGEKQLGIVLDEACVNNPRSSRIRYPKPTLSDSAKIAPSMFHLRQPRSGLTHREGASNRV